jgi:hypothetical protein
MARGFPILPRPHNAEVIRNPAIETPTERGGNRERVRHDDGPLAARSERRGHGGAATIARVAEHEVRRGRRLGRHAVTIPPRLAITTCEVVDGMVSGTPHRIATAAAPPRHQDRRRTSRDRPSDPTDLSPWRHLIASATSWCRHVGPWTGRERQRDIRSRTRVSIWPEGSSPSSSCISCR